MEVWLYICVFILGAIIGSFNNVLIIRGAERRAVTGRSACMQCNTVLQWFELIPIVSFFVQRGTCRSCRSQIAVQYPLIEFMTGAVFFIAVYVFGFTVTAAMMVFLSELLLIIAVYDALHMEIPNMWNYIWVGASVVFGVVTKGVLFSFIGLCIPLLFFLLWYVSEGRALGFGDVIFAIGMGASLGLLPGLVAVWIASTIGACYGGFLLFRARAKKHAHVTLKTQVPFGPFLAIGTYAALLMGPSLFVFLESLLYIV